MKKILSMLLTLAMIISMVCSVSVSVSALTEGWVTIYLDENLSDFITSYASGQEGAQDRVLLTWPTENGNTCAKYELKQEYKDALTMDKILGFHFTDEIADLFPGMTFPIVSEPKIPAGKTGRVSFDYKSVFNGVSGAHFDSTYNKFMYMGVKTEGGAGGFNMSNGTNVRPTWTDLGDGWEKVMFPTVTVGTDTVALTTYDTTRFPHPEFSSVGFTSLIKRMAAEGLYYGVYGYPGWYAPADYSSLTYVIDESNSCISWKDDKNGEYRITNGSDFSWTKCTCNNNPECPRYQKSLALVNDYKNFYYLIDNYRFEVKANLYNTTITGVDSARVTTNTYVDDATTVSNGEKVVANDLCGLKVEVDGIMDATYNGVKLNTVNYNETSNKTTITIPAASLVDNGTLAIAKGTKTGWVVAYLEDAPRFTERGYITDKSTETESNGNQFTKQVIKDDNLIKGITGGDEWCDALREVYKMKDVNFTVPAGVTARGAIDYKVAMPGGTFMTSDQVKAEYNVYSYMGSAADTHIPAGDFTTAPAAGGNNWVSMYWPEVKTTEEVKAFGAGSYFKHHYPAASISELMLQYGVYEGAATKLEHSINNWSGMDAWFNSITRQNYLTLDETNICKNAPASVVPGTRSLWADFRDTACQCTTDADKATCPRALRKAEFIEEAKKLWFGFDNFRVEVKAKLYENTISGATGVVVTTNPVTDEKVTVSNNGSFEANDWYGFTVAVPGAVSDAKYNGYAVECTFDPNINRTVITVPKNMVSEKGVLNIEIAAGDVIKTRERIETFKGGNVSKNSKNYGYAYTTDGGVLSLSLQSPNKSFADSETVNEEEGYFQWKYNYCGADVVTEGGDAIPNNNTARMYAAYNVKIASNREYEFVIKGTNAGDVPFNPGYIQWNTSRGVGVTMDGSDLPEGFKLNNTIWYTNPAPQIEFPANSNRIVTGKLPHNSVSVNNAPENTVWYFNNVSMDFPGDQPAGSLPRFYGGGIRETAVYHNITMNLGGGRYSALVDTLNFGTDNITDNAKILQVEDYADVTLYLMAPEGKVFDKVEFLGIDYSSSLTGKHQGAIRINDIKSSGVLRATFKNDTKEKNVTLTAAFANRDYVYTDKNGISKKIPLSIVLYGTVVGSPAEYGFKLSNGEKTVTLPVLAASDSFAVRIVGNLADVNYTASTYMKDTNGIEIVGDMISVDMNQSTYFYVAENGKDEYIGTKNYPFATLNKAVEAAKKIGGGTIIVREGEYALGDTIEIGADDGKIEIYGDGDVTFTGGVKLPYSSFSSVTDPAVLNRIVEQTGKANVKVADLKALGVNVLSAMKPQGYMAELDDAGYNPSTTFMSDGTPRGFGATLTYKDKNLTIAEYPNGGFAKVGESIKSKPANGYSVAYKIDNNRWQKWANAKDMYALGYYYVSWCYTNAPATLDSNGVVSTHTSYANATVGSSVRFRNLLEELDVPGEYYVDVENGKLYIIPPTGFKEGEYLTYSSHDKDIFKLDGAKEFTLCGIRFEGTTENCIEAVNSTLITVDDCEFTGIGDTVIKITGCFGSNIKNSRFHDIGSEGIFIDRCGDRQNLVSAKTVVNNCSFERFSNYKRSYAPAIKTRYDVGSVIKHCEFKDAPHSAIIFVSNDTIIQYNEFSNCCYETGDSGVVYTGCHYNTWGNEINYNYFHDISQASGTSHRVQAVYLDDCHAQTKVYGNVFYKVSAPGLYGGGRNNTFENNIILEANQTFEFDNRGMTWSNSSAEGGMIQCINNSNAIDWTTPRWIEKYPQIEGFMQDQPGIPKYNVIKNNVMYSSAGTSIDGNVSTYGTVESFKEMTSVSGVFSNYGTDFTLTTAGLNAVRALAPNFQNIPFNQIGTYAYKEPVVPEEEKAEAQTE